MLVKLKRQWRGRNYGDGGKGFRATGPEMVLGLVNAPEVFKDIPCAVKDGGALFGRALYRARWADWR